MKKSLFSCIVLLFVACSAPRRDNGLVADFSFDNGTARDEVSNKEARALAVSYSKDRFGNAASACYFQGGEGSYLNLGTSENLKPVNGSISLWFNMDNIVLGGKGVLFNPFILTKSHAGNDFYEGYYIGYDIGPRRINITTTESKNNQVMIRSADVIQSQKWYHVVMTFDSSSLALYINGVLENKVPKNFKSKYLASDSVMVGNSANEKNKRFFNGSIDDIRIYNRMLNSKEVAELYNMPDPKALNSVVKWLLISVFSIGGVIAMVIFGFNQYYKRELGKQKAANELNARLNELETRAMRTQMNPHFIFNSLNTIQRFILEDDNANAHLYLTNFSKLLRKLLESSVSDSIPLTEEIDILNKYLEVEKLRFDNSFEYEVRSELDPAENSSIPVMLIQPFVENAIWHGLLPKEGIRKLKVIFSAFDAKRILCVIDDNGVGREYSARQKEPLNKKSMAIDFVKQRLELLGKAKGIECNLEIIDKKNAGGESEGTMVKIIIPKFK